jgi:hypothetical protein
MVFHVGNRTGRCIARQRYVVQFLTAQGGLFIGSYMQRARRIFTEFVGRCEVRYA